MKKLLGKYGLTVRDLMQCIGGSVVACVLVFMIMIGMLTASAGCNDTTVQEPEKHYLVGDIGDVMIVDHVVNHPKVVKRIADIGLEDGYLSKTTDDYGNYFKSFGLGWFHADGNDYQQREVFDAYGSYLKDAPFVLDMEVLRWQECADFAMRMHINAQLNRGKLATVHSNKEVYKYKDALPTNKQLEKMYNYANSYSIVHNDLMKIELTEIQPGDLLAIGGYPGHVVVIMDVVKDSMGNEHFLLAQSFIPAQTPHIVENWTNKSYWFSVNDCVEKGVIDVGGYIFRTDRDVYRWSERALSTISIGRITADPNITHDYRSSDN
jgi:hypothetical protein|tara:strand:- start:3308 stop:4273 length:966 start_codon:yes stop_codon:yes gene_type:complete